MNIMKPSIKIIRNYLKLLKDVLKRTTFSNQYSPLKIILKRLRKLLKIQLVKVNATNRIFLRKLLLIIQLSITDETKVAVNFNKFFAEIGPKLAKEIETSTIKFCDYLKKCNTILPNNPVSINELKDTFFSTSDK